jgi:hypothetical protein
MVRSGIWYSKRFGGKQLRNNELWVADGRWDKSTSYMITDIRPLAGEGCNVGFSSV